MNVKLTTEAQEAVCGILAVGGTRQMAARYVGCHERTIRNLARRDAEFAKKLRETELSPEVNYLKVVKDASQDAKHWRAASWALQHMYPERYSRQVDRMTVDEVQALISQLTDSIAVAVTDVEQRRRLYRHVRRLIRRMDPRCLPKRVRRKKQTPQPATG